MQRLFATFAFVLIAAASGGEARAQADPYGWCAEYSGSAGGGRNCYFVTLEQCRAAVSGVGGVCAPNPFYTGPDRATPAQRQRRR